MKNFKPSSSFLLAMLLIICAGASNIVFACGGGWDSGYLYYKFFHDADFIDSDYYGLLYEPDYPLSIDDSQEEDLNIKAWVRHFGLGFSASEIQSVVYRMPLETLMEINAVVSGTSTASVPEPYQDFVLVRKWREGRHLEALRYLLYAKQCETQSMQTTHYWYGDTPNENTLDRKLELLASGEQLFTGVESDFYRERYGYQLVRMAHYSEQFSLADSIYQSIFPDEPDAKNYIAWRALEQRAGALNGLDDPSAPYYFAKTFLTLPDRRDVCLRSFRFTNASDWEASFARCKTKEERSLFYMLRALHYDGYELEEMENIYAIDPTSILLPIMVCRQVNMIEREAFPTSYWDLNLEEEPAQENEGLERLLLGLIEHGNPKDKELYITSLASLKIYGLAFESSLEWLAKIPESSPHADQARLLQFVAQLSMVESGDPETEDRFFHAWNDDPYLKKCDDCRSWMLDHFARMNYKEGQLGKAFLCQYELSWLESNIDLKAVDQLLSLEASNAKSDFESYLIGASGLNRPDLVELKGSWYMQRNQLNEAITWFEQLPSDYENSKYGNPTYFNNDLFGANYQHHFRATLAEQSDSIYNEIEYSAETYNKLTLCREFLRLEEMAEGGNKQSAELYYALGSAWLNMCPYGFLRNVLYHHYENEHAYDYYVNGIERPEEYELMNGEPFYYYNPGIATDYFEKALSETSDREFQARIAFMASKSDMYKVFSQGPEKRLWFTSPDFFREPYSKEMEWYNRFQKEFSDTRFYEEAIRECGYFQAYVGY